MAVGSQWYREAHRKWKLHSGVNSLSWESRKDIQWWWMQYSVYAVVCLNWWYSHGEIERVDLTLCSAMMVELWSGKREMGDEDENHVDDTSGYETSGEQHAPTGLRRPGIREITWRSGLVPAVSEIVSSLAHKISRSPSFPWCFPSSPFISLLLVLNSTIT